MRRIGLSAKLTMTVGILASVIVAIAAVSIGVLIYIQTEQQIRKQLSSTSSVIIKDYLTHDQGHVALQKKDDGQSLVVLLRNMDMSLFLTNASGSAIAEYGIYRNISSTEKQSLFQMSELNVKNHISTGRYVDKEIPQIGRLDTLTVPLWKGTEVIGYMQLSRINNIWPVIIQSLMWALLIQLPITWIAAVYVIRWGTHQTLMPLNELVSTVETLDVDQLPEHLAEPSRMDHDVMLLYQTLHVLMSKIRMTLVRQREMAQNISHEFKTPLTRVISRLSLIHEDLPPDQKTVVDAAMNDLVGLGEQVDGLLDVAMYESSVAQKKSSHALFLRPLIEDIGSKLSKSKKITCDIPHGMRVPIPMGHARTIWRNLLENAAKYSSGDGAITVGAREALSSWTVVVSNAANTDDISSTNVFIRHYRGFVSHSIQGHGLGMAIVRDICKHLGLEVKYMVDDTSRVRVEVSGKK